MWVRHLGPSYKGTLQRLASTIFQQNCKVSHPFAIRYTSSIQSHSQLFDDFYPSVLLRDFAAAYKQPDPDFHDWSQNILDEFLVPKKKPIGLAVVDAYNSLANNVTPENLKRAVLIGWCIELFDVTYVILENAMNWPLDRLNIAGVGLDSGLTKRIMFKMIKKYFANEQLHSDFIELFHSVENEVSYGIRLEHSCLNEVGRLHEDAINLEFHNKVCRLRHGYSCYLPVASAMILAGKAKPEWLQQLKPLLMDTALLAKLQEWYLSEYSCDRQQYTARLNWPIVYALSKANDTQKSVLLDCYGHATREKVGAVRNIYAKLGVKQACRECHATLMEDIMQRIQKLPQQLPKQFIMEFTNQFRIQRL